MDVVSPLTLVNRFGTLNQLMDTVGATCNENLAFSDRDVGNNVKRDQYYKDHYRVNKDRCNKVTNSDVAVSESKAA